MKSIEIEKTTKIRITPETICEGKILMGWQVTHYVHGVPQLRVQIGLDKAKGILSGENPNYSSLEEYIFSSLTVGDEDIDSLSESDKREVLYQIEELIKSS